MYFSPLRAQLASIDNAYRLGARRLTATGRVQFIVRTGDPFQPFRVTTVPPRHQSRIAMVIA
jgi:hypothetical protein